MASRGGSTGGGIPARAGRALGRRIAEARVELLPLEPRVLHLRMSTRLLRRQGLYASAYLLDDLLVDTGTRQARGRLLRALEGRPVLAIACTHHHEDHVGNAGTLAEVKGCPVYLRNPRARFDEGVAAMPPYRRVYWGEPGPFAPLEMPEVVETAARRLRAVPTPGHSATHTAFFEEETGLALTGDLYVSSGASAVMTHENPYETIASLRRIADLEPALVLTGHDLALERPAARLRQKADRIEEAAGRVLELRREGLGARAIQRRIFRSGRTADRLIAAMTGGEFSRANFVRACLRHGGGR